MTNSYLEPSTYSGSLLDLFKQVNIFLRCGRHAWTQYFNLGLTSDWYNLNNIALSLLTNVLLIMPSIRLADFTAAAHWLLDFKFCLIITPKSFSSNSDWIHSSPRKELCCLLLYYPKCLTLHFSTLNNICQSICLYDLDLWPTFTKIGSCDLHHILKMCLFSSL